MNLKIYTQKTIDDAQKGQFYKLGLLVEKLRFDGYEGRKYAYPELVKLFADFNVDEGTFEDWCARLDD